MKFKYIGDDNSPPKATTVFGFKFDLDGSAVDIKDSNAIQKLKGNKCFKEVRSSGNTGGSKKKSTEKVGFSFNEPSANE